jgi:DNA repair protein RadA
MQQVIQCQSQIQQQIKSSFFISASELWEIKKSKDSFTTGVAILDDLLFVPELRKYGILLGETYELAGGFKSGKSQLSHQLCTTVQLPRDQGGIGKKAIFIDTERTFSPSRIIAMSDHLIGKYQLDATIRDFLSNILVATAPTTQQQIAIVQQLFESLSSRPNEFGLIVIDSGTALFRSEYIGQEQLTERQQQLNRFLSILSRLAYSFNIAVVLTNQILSSPDLIFGDSSRPVGGNILAHWANHRLYLKSSRGNSRTIRIIDSPIYPEVDATFRICTHGICQGC